MGSSGERAVDGDLGVHTAARERGEERRDRQHHLGPADAGAQGLAAREQLRGDRGRDARRVGARSVPHSALGRAAGRRRSRRARRRAFPRRGRAGARARRDPRARRPDARAPRPGRRAGSRRARSRAPARSRPCRSPRAYAEAACEPEAGRAATPRCGCRARRRSGGGWPARSGSCRRTRRHPRAGGTSGSAPGRHQLLASVDEHRRRAGEFVDQRVGGVGGT